LAQCYSVPNNFTSHGAYQYQYASINWRHSFDSDLRPADFKLTTSVRWDELSPFYAWLAKHPGDRPVVEYPMMIGDQFNVLYYYQHFHHRPVMIGYKVGVPLTAGMPEGTVYGNTYVDQVLDLVEDQNRLEFQNIVRLDNVAKMRDSNVEFVILHKRFEAQLYELASPILNSERLCDGYRSLLGQPAYEDEQVVVFKL